jgi:MinD superfamily P-loop ATPase
MIISIASGKGGTGKTLVATSLALALKDNHKVKLLDGDAEEPNDHVFLKPKISGCEPVFIAVPKVDEKKCTRCGQCAELCAFNAIAVLGEHVLTFHELCHGCGACSYLCPEKAIAEEERPTGVVEWGSADGIDFVQGKLNVGEAMPSPVIRAVKRRIDSDGINIIDSPPGTSCPVVTTIEGSDFCLLVTEPTPFGLNDLVLAVETVRKLGIDCGVVLNRAGVGDNSVEDYCRRENIPVLLTIPLDTEIARFYSKGITLVEGRPEWQEKFVGLFAKIKEIVDARNRRLKR